MTTELQGQRKPAPPAPVLTSECTRPPACERTVVAVSCAQLGGGQEALYMGAAWPKARPPKAAGTSSQCRCGASGRLCFCRSADVGPLGGCVSVTVQMWGLWAVVFLSQCRCGASGQLCSGFGVTDTLVQDRATKQTTSKACPTVLGEGNKFCPRGSSLLLKTQRQN